MTIRRPMRARGDNYIKDVERHEDASCLFLPVSVVLMSTSTNVFAHARNCHVENMVTNVYSTTSPAPFLKGTCMASLVVSTPSSDSARNT